jgi:hypothetical protein
LAAGAIFGLVATGLVKDLFQIEDLARTLLPEGGAFQNEGCLHDEIIVTIEPDLNLGMF